MSKYRVTVWQGQEEVCFGDGWTEVELCADTCFITQDGDLFLHDDVGANPLVAIFARDCWRQVVRVEEQGCCCE